jgi:hypothetical protein
MRLTDHELLKIPFMELVKINSPTGCQPTDVCYVRARIAQSDVISK